MDVRFYDASHALAGEMSTPAPSNPPAEGSVPSPADEVRHLYRASSSAEAGPDRDRYLSLLKAFLAAVESQQVVLGPVGEEIGPWLDEAAMAFYRNGQAPLARRAVDLGLVFQPGAVTLLHHKALILLAQNQDIPEVVKLVDQALVANPHDKTLWATRGDALKLLDQPKDAAEAYLRAQQLDASSTQYVDKALKLVPNEPRALRLRLDLAQALGGDVSALEAADELLKTSPDEPGLILARARLLATLGRAADALEALAPLEGGRPDDDPVNVLRVRLLFDLGRPGDAVTVAKPLVERDKAPDHAQLIELIRLTEPQAPEVALRARQRLAEADPRNLQNLHDLRVLAVRLDDAEAAMSACRAALATQPDNLEAMSGIAELEASAEHVDAALNAYRALAKAHPQAIVELRRALDLARIAGQEAAVREFAESILAEDPTDVPAQLELARAFAAEGNTEGALHAYDTLLAAHPGKLPYLLEKKELLAASQDPKLLAPVVDELFRVDPTRVDIAVERGNLYLALAYELHEGSAERDQAAHTALVAYERASTDAEAAAVADLGIARASRLAGDSDRAIRSYESFLHRPENQTRNDVLKELAHALRETSRYSDALALYTKAIMGGAEDPDVLWGAVEVLDHLNQEPRGLQLLDLLLRRDPENPVYLRKQGQLLLRIGQRDDALRVLQKAVQSAQGDPQAYFEVAEALRSQGAYADAVTYFRKGLELEPTHRHGRVALAETLLLAGQYSDVVQITDPLLKENPNDIAAWKARADAWRALGRPAEVLYSLKAILLLESDDPACLLEKYRIHRDSGETKEAYEALSHLLSTPAPEAQDATLHLERGDLAARLGLSEEANQSYERAAEIDPALKSEIAIRRARLRLGAGRPDLALEVLEEGKAAATDGAPTPAGQLLLRAEILIALERPGEARTVYEDVLTRDPKSPTALAGVGRTMLDEGRHVEAADFLHGALGRVPPSEALYLLLAEAESGAAHLDRAQEAVQQGVTALPKSAALWSRLGEVAIARQDWAGGAGAYQHAIALEPNVLSNLLRAGYVAERLNHPNESFAFYERATETDPTNAQAWTSRGISLLALGRPQDAATSFDRALSLDSDYAPAKDGRKLALEKTRDQQVQKYGREALLLEARLNRPIAKNDLFVTLHVPFELLEPVLSAISRTNPIDLDRLSPAEVKELETASYHLITAAFERRPPGIEHRGFTLADVAVLSAPTATLDQIERSFGYLRAVLEADIRAENLKLAPDVEELARRALVLPAEQRTLFQLVRTLRVGIYKARLIRIVEESGATAHAPLPSLDLGAYSPEFRTPAAPAGPGAEEAAEEAGERYFSPETTPAPSPGAAAPPTSHPPPAASTTVSPAAPAARCIGCGGIASVRHSCGSPLCQHCIGQFPHCPKCGQSISPISVAPLAGVMIQTTAARPARSPPLTAGLKGVFSRNKAPAKPPSHAGGPAPEAAKNPRPSGPPGRAPVAAPPAAARKPAPTGAVPAPQGAKPAAIVPEPPAPPPPRPRREKPDDEPRL
ncbi:MAG: tetratricopeptide repeat protein [Thermoplasmata archaeon]